MADRSAVAWRLWLAWLSGSVAGSLHPPMVSPLLDAAISVATMIAALGLCFVGVLWRGGDG